MRLLGTHRATYDNIESHKKAENAKLDELEGWKRLIEATYNFHQVQTGQNKQTEFLSLAYVLRHGNSLTRIDSLTVMNPEEEFDADAAGTRVKGIFVLENGLDRELFTKEDSFYECFKHIETEYMSGMSCSFENTAA